MQTKRPPIVTVLGHVDHGKTTLLDAIRKTNIAAREAGGITQSIGASKINTSFGPVTFIDTPGHAAFSAMRSRGAHVADIAILVVAADDGIMPQTREALKMIQEAKVPFIVAFTKIDMPSANVERAKAQLEQEGILFEGRGGDTPSIEISAKTGTNIQELLELISLLSEVHDIKGDPEGKLEAVVVETNKDQQGVVVSAVVRNGTLAIGDDVAADTLTGRIKGLFDGDRKPVKFVSPGDPVVVLGFSDLPPVGSAIYRPSEGAPERSIHSSLDATKGKSESAEGKVSIILKSQNKGSMEALFTMLPEGVHVHESSIGEVTETDVFLAKTTGSIIVSFDAKVPGSVLKLAQNENVKIMSFKIIYELIQYLEKVIHEGDLVVLGKAEVLGVFPYENKKVAGIKMINGRIAIKDTLIVERNKEEVGRVRVVSMRKLKDSITEAREGQECGIIFEPQITFQVKDILTSIKI